MLLTVTALIAGVLDDVPGIKEHPLGEGILGFLSSFFHTVLTILWNYPVEVALALLTVALFRWVFVTDHVASMNQELEYRRKLRFVKKKKQVKRNLNEKDKNRRKNNRSKAG